MKRLLSAVFGLGLLLTFCSPTSAQTYIQANGAHPSQINVRNFSSKDISYLCDCVDQRARYVDPDGNADYIWGGAGGYGGTLSPNGTASFIPEFIDVLMSGPAGSATSNAVLLFLYGVEVGLNHYSFYSCTYIIEVTIPDGVHLDVSYYTDSEGSLIMTFEATDIMEP